jgi:Concanavalin A-like lectin/glucanases superfamily
MQRKRVSWLLIAALCLGVLQTSVSNQIAQATGGPAGSVEFTYTGLLGYTPNQYLSFSNIQLTGDFTIETWVKFKSTDHYASFLGQYGSSSVNRWIFQNFNNELKFQYHGPGANDENNLNFTTSVPLNQWIHLAVVRSGTTLKSYFNGSNGYTNLNVTQTIGASTDAMRIGSGPSNGNDRFDGFITNYRITNTAAYTSNFTPSRSPLTAITGTQVLLNMTNDENFLVDSSSFARTLTSYSYGVTSDARNGRATSSAQSPFLSLSSTSETALTGSPIAGYQLTNTNPNDTSYTATVVGVGSFSSPRNGISFNTSTGLFSGSPTSAAAAETYLVAGATSKASATFSLSVVSGQTITFGALADKIISDTPPTLSATASSGLTVAFTSATTGVCTVSGTSVTFVGSGTCTINANQAGDATRAAAPQVQRSFAIAYLTQTISFDALTGATLGVSSAPLIRGSASSGLGITYSSATPGVCAVSGSIISMLNPGTCTISASQAGNGTYSAAATVSQSFSITAKPDDGQKELMEILTLLPEIASISKNLGDLTFNTMTKCVKGKSVKRVKLGAKCPKGYVKRK